MKAFQRPAPRPADVDVPLPVLEAEIRALVARQRVDVAVDKLRWLLAEQTHQVDPADAAFARLACEHPDACSRTTDYPGWTPPHLTPMEASS